MPAVVNQHDVPFLRLPGGGNPDNFPDISCHRPGRAKIQLEVQAVLLIECFTQSLGSLRSESRRSIELDHALLLRAGNEFVNGRSIGRVNQPGNKKHSRSARRSEFPFVHVNTPSETMALTALVGTLLRASEL